MQLDDDVSNERRITIEPPLVGKVFRVITDQNAGPLTFDLLATMVLNE